MRAMRKNRVLAVLGVLIVAAAFAPWAWRSHQTQRHAQDLAARLASAQKLDPTNVESAFLAFETLVELDPSNAAAWSGLARAWRDAKMPWAAEGAATHAVELAPSAETLLLRAQVREQLGRNFSAALDARRALELAPASAEAKDLLQRADSAPLSGPHLAPPREKFWPGRLLEYVRQVPREIQKQDWEAAGKLAIAAERDYPGTMIGPWLGGIVRYAHGQFVDAEAELKRALALAPRSSRVATNLAGAWAKQKGPAYAAGELLKLHEADPGFLVPLDIAATAYLQLHQPADAEAALRRGLAVKDPAPQAFLQLASFFRALDRAADAQKVCDDGLARAPQDLALQLCRAEVIAPFAPEQAISAYDSVLRQRPDAVAARVALTRLYARRPDDASVQRASELAAELRRDSPDDGAALDAVGWVLARQKSWREARQWLALAAQDAPDDPSIRYHHAAALNALGERDAARREAQAAVALGQFPERPEALALSR